MEINKTINDKTAIFAVSGRLDTNTAPSLDTEIQGCIQDIDELILDFSGLEYISSAGLRILLSAQKTLKGRKGLTIRHPNDTVSEVFEITGFADILTIEK